MLPRRSSKSEEAEPMAINALVYEIGSTTTLVNYFTDLDSEHPRFAGGAQSPTTVDEGDVTIGLQEARKALEAQIGEIKPTRVYATSSAAGGLRMSVHGLVHDMTVKAAKEAALGAGANITFLTAGKLRRSDLARIKEQQPNIFLIAGGVDFGERDTALHNAEMLLELDLDIPFIYAGNIENQEDIRLMFEEKGRGGDLFLCENVYPRLDQLNVEPTRTIIQNVFESHITEAKGMSKIRGVVDSHVIPTPGSVMLATKLLAQEYEDVLTLDVGGATSDVHSVTAGNEEIAEIAISPEPRAKRTVEGDLGLFINRENLIGYYEKDKLSEISGLTPEELEEELAHYQPIPQTPKATALACALARKAVDLSVHRHAGQLLDFFYTGGKRQGAQGKDLTNIRYIIGTGGALTRLPCAKSIMEDIPFTNKGDRLLPREGVEVLIDKEYIMASLGVLSMEYPQAALALLKGSLEL